MNKKLIIILSSIIGFLVLLILVIWLITLFKHTYYSYETVEEKTVEAAKKYHKKYPELLPVTDGKYSLDYNALVTEELIKPLNELLKDGDKCNMSIYYTKSDNNYSYFPMLNCGEEYQTRELYRQILNDNAVVTTGSGLYQSENGEYYFKGKIENNYVLFGSYINGSNDKVDLIWKIISISPDNSIRLRAIRRTEDRTVWDDRYNINKDNRVGYNDFEMSVLKQFLVKFEDNPVTFNTEEKQLVVGDYLCIAPRKTNDTSKDGSTECSVKTTNKMLFSTLLPYEYLRASLDDNCKSLEDPSCVNYNYLADNASGNNWLITANPVDNYHAYSFNGDSISSNLTNVEKYIFPVVNLTQFATYKSGDGTLENPYRLFKKEDK